MTSEIAVMNQRAVVLAADSAVTLIGGGTVAVRNDHRKLFNLVGGRPVGLMFFGVADLMGHPWEHLIEHYQKRIRPKPFAHVRDYAVSFTAMMDNLEEFFPRAKQRDEYRRLLASVFRYVFHLAQFMSDNADGERQSDGAILEAAIERVWRDYQFREDGSPRADLSCFPPNFGAAVLREYTQQIEEIVAYGFGRFQLSQGAMQRLREIAVYAVVKDLFLEDVTGLVFAGFGEDERYPNLVTYFASAIIGGYLKRAEASADAIDTDTKSKIRVFADSEVTNAFIRGIDFNLERRLYGGFRMIMGGLVDQVIAAFPQADPAQRNEIRARFQGSFVPRYFDAFRNMIADYQQQTFINPILRVLEIASRTELAETAKELVGLNIFKKRIMAQKETVGGAIDVAMISRENGFQWFSRQDGG
ncbi:MAG TPA: hypothetical protein VGH02_00130 [Rhizomicrobium sp.]|jgi:hypothetical protein